MKNFSLRNANQVGNIVAQLWELALDCDICFHVKAIDCPIF